MTITRPHTLTGLQDRQALTGLATAARGASERAGFVDISIDGHASRVPHEVALAISEALDAFAAGQGVMIGQVEASVTTGRAAKMLGISRTYLCTLIDGGDIPCHYVGTHRRLHLRDILTYAERRRAERQEALDELSRLSAEAGLYDDDL